MPLRVNSEGLDAKDSLNAVSTYILGLKNVSRCLKKWVSVGERYGWVGGWVREGNMVDVVKSHIPSQ